MIRAIALDDEPLALRIIANYCERIAYITLEKTFTRPDDAQRHLRRQPVDLVFLDVQMPRQSGLQFRQQMGPDVMVIFMTAFSEYAVEGFNLNALDYLLKPFSFERFLQAAEKAKSAHEVRRHAARDQPQYLLVRADYSLHKIPLGEILFIEGLDDYLKIHVANQKTIVARMTMKSILEKLPPHEFMRVHRSFIVPVSRVDKLRNKTIYIGSDEIPVSSNYEAAFLERIGGGTS